MSEIVFIHIERNCNSVRCCNTVKLCVAAEAEHIIKKLFFKLYEVVFQKIDT